MAEGSHPKALGIIIETVFHKHDTKALHKDISCHFSDISFWLDTISIGIVMLVTPFSS